MIVYKRVRRRAETIAPALRQHPYRYRRRRKSTNGNTLYLYRLHYQHEEAVIMGTGPIELGSQNSHTPKKAIDVEAPGTATAHQISTGSFPTPFHHFTLLSFSLSFRPIFVFFVWIVRLFFRGHGVRENVSVKKLGELKTNPPMDLVSSQRGLEHLL